MKNRQMIRLLFFTILTLLLSTGASYSQSRKLEKADRAFELHQYNQAVELYNKAHRKVSRKNKSEGARVTFQIAMCYKFMNQPRRAENTFRRAIRQNYPDPIAILYLAEAMLQNEKYEEALIEFNKYKEKKPDDTRAELGINSAKFAIEMLENTSRYEVEISKRFSSRSSDFTPAFADHLESSLIFASSRDGALSDKTDPWTGENFTSLFISFLDRQGNWSNPALLDEGPVNTQFNEGAPSFNATFTTMYITRCPSDPGKRYGCRIFASNLAGSDWGEPSEVVLFNDTTISVGHPAISPDELTLYFVAELPEGKGGKDIWIAKRTTPSGSFEKISLLDSVINTAGDEMFPYLRHDGVLFFSSTGHAGLGGLDIFYSQPQGNTWTKPVNLGVPINSSGDDFGIVFFRGKESGFFSSNRGRAGTDNIYSFVLPPLLFTLRGTVRDDITKEPIDDVTVQMIGSDGTIVQSETDKQGRFLFDKNQVRQDTRYDILISKEKYFSARGQETTVGISRSRDFVNDFYLAPIPQKPIELPQILYEFASFELKPQYQDSLRGLIQTLQDNPKLIIELASHTDSRGTHDYNDTLSQKRAQTVVEFLVSNGIDKDRLVAKGYGKRVPRKIEKVIERDGFTFEEGTELTEKYISSLPTEKQRDVANQLNRRTEFRVLSEDYSTDKSSKDEKLSKPYNTGNLKPEDKKPK
ncbi:MAG: OmpA family protein [Bacteroidetes bacterium]|nr:OmpA family protein [Bacteroidota bacterium]